MKKEVFKILQTVILLYDGVPEGELLLKFGFGPQLKKAKEIIKILNR